jgi:polyferredoxin
MGYAQLADGVVAFHVAYVGFIVIGQLLIVAGAICQWQWVRNLWFRLAHLVAIAIVAVEAACNYTCPLTTLERTLREWAGEQASTDSFIARQMHSFIEHDWPQWMFNVIHISFAFLVLLTFVLARPRWPWVSHARAAARGLS